MIRSRVQTTLKELPAKARLMKEVKLLHKAYVKVGVQSDAPKYPNGVTVAQVALWNEFGAAHTGFGYTPERSFFRSTLNEEKGRLNNLKRELIAKIVSGQFTAFKALDNMGFVLQAAIHKKIRSGVPPPNAPYTIKLKKHEAITPITTLIFTDHMLRNITTQVVIGGDVKKGTQAP